MKFNALSRLFWSLICLLGVSASVTAQSAPPNTPNARLAYVIVLSRHGVRSPIDGSHSLDQYSATPWPKWDVPPSYLTPHGYQILTLLGAWDRANFAAQGLFAGSGCDDAAHVSILADTDERTIQTGKALAEGMFPGCVPSVQSKPEGTPDPLYRIVGGPHEGGGELAAAAILGRIGGSPDNLTQMLHPQLAALDRILAGCSHVNPADSQRKSIFDVPIRMGGLSAFSSAYSGPASVAATMTENFLLEYTTGMSDADTGFGCLDGNTLRGLMQINTATWDYAYRTPALARMNAASMLYHIERSLEQHVSGKPVEGALSKPDDRLLVIVGHDSNIVAVAGAMGMDWIIDGRAGDTPPGGALLFEVWKPADGGKPFVRVEYTAQTLEQMRFAQPLTEKNPPADAKIFVPACGRADGSCSWEGFSAAMKAAIEPSYVVK